MKLLASQLDIAVEIQAKERSCVFVRAAFAMIEAQRGAEALDDFIDNFGLDRQSNEFKHLMGAGNLCSYLLEATVYEQWLKLFDHNLEQLKSIGKELALGGKLGKSPFSHFKFYLYPLSRALPALVDTFNGLSKISHTKLKLRFSKHEDFWSALMVTSYNLPAGFERPHVSTIYLASGILDGMRIRKSIKPHTRWVGTPLNAIQNEKGEMQIHMRMLIGNTWYAHKNDSYFLKWPREPSFVKRTLLNRRMGLLLLEEREREIQKLVEQNRKRLQKFEAELSDKNRLIAEKNALMDHELVMAAGIQRGILPKDMPEWRGITAAVLDRPLEKITGDYFDMFYLKDSLGVLMTDASGHGVPAALITMAAKQTFTSLVHSTKKPSELFKEVNTEIVERVKTSDYLTAFYIVIDRNYKARYSNASHQQAILLRATGKVEFLDTPGLFIGAIAEAAMQYEDGEVQLEPGDRLILYTDGIVEHKNMQAEEFGEERFIEVLEKHRESDLDTLNQAVFAALEVFMDGAAKRDDITIFSLELNPQIAAFLQAYDTGIALYKVKQVEAAEAAFMKAHVIIPSDVRAIRHLAISNYKLKNYEKSLGFFKKLVEHDSLDQVSYYYQMRCLNHMKNFEAATESGLIALRLKPNDARTATYLGFSFFNSGDATKATKYLLIAKELNSTHARLEEILSRAQKDATPGGEL